MRIRDNKDFFDVGWSDDVFMDDVKCVHIEQLDEGQIWMRVQGHDGTAVVVSFCNALVGERGYGQRRVRRLRFKVEEQGADDA